MDDERPRRPLHLSRDDLPPERAARLVSVGGRVPESMASLNLHGDDLDPDEITRLLGCPPSASHRKGDVKPHPKHRIVQRTGFWSMDSDRPDDASLKEHVTSLFDRVTNDPQVWEALSKRFRISVFCGLFLDEWNRGEELSPAMLRRIADAHATLGLDIYGPTSSMPTGMRALLEDPNRDPDGSGPV